MKLKNILKKIKSVKSKSGLVVYLFLAFSNFVILSLTGTDPASLLQTEMALAFLDVIVLIVFWLGRYLIRGFKTRSFKLSFKGTFFKIFVLLFLIATSFTSYVLYRGVLKEDSKQLKEITRLDELNKETKKKADILTDISKELNLKSKEELKTLRKEKVKRVIDGDTLEMEFGKVRIIGLNTPETVDPRRKVECFGKEASSKAKELLDGKEVYLESDPSQGEVDKYGRYLFHVFTENGINYANYLIANGYGYEYTYRVPYKYKKAYKEAEKIARNKKRGLWADDTCKGIK